MDKIICKLCGYCNLQRVKNPPIPLKDFSSVESMKEEIYEVVAFLQNPLAFQEMGARAPRVCDSQDVILIMHVRCLLYFMGHFCLVDI